MGVPRCCSTTLREQAAAAEGCVLLKNAGGVLPLAPGARLAVVGPNAGCGTSGSGNGTQPPCAAQVSWQGRERAYRHTTCHPSVCAAAELPGQLRRHRPAASHPHRCGGRRAGLQLPVSIYLISLSPALLQRRSRRHLLRRQWSRLSPTRRGRLSTRTTSQASLPPSPLRQAPTLSSQCSATRWTLRGRGATATASTCPGRR